MNKEKKQQIVDISIDLFAKHGIKNITVERIAKETGSSRGRIYYYFAEGKSGIVSAILQMFEDYVKGTTSKPKEWESKNADAKQILSNLFFSFEGDNAVIYRKILHILFSEMFNNMQVKEYILNILLFGREQSLANFFQALSDNGLIMPLDFGSIARCLNRILFVYAIIDALIYPKELNNQVQIMTRDCENIINYILTRT